MKHFTIAILVIVSLVLITATNPAWAEDVRLDTTVDSVVTSLDKNGNSYTRVIINETRSMNGVEYDRQIPLMFFGSLATEAETIKSGDTISVIASKRTYQGRESYTALKLIK